MRNNILLLFLLAFAGLTERASAQVILSTDSIPVACDFSGNIYVPVRVENFTGVGAFQFTLMWDTAYLDYQFTTPMNPLLLTGAVNVGFDSTTFINSGKIAMTWTKFGGGTVPDNTIVFSLVFKRTDGPYTPVMFVNTPVPVEVTDPLAEPLPFDTINGGIAPLDTIPPTISCPANLTVSGIPPVLVTGIAPSNITDNCSVYNIGWTATGATTVNAPNDPDASGAFFNLGNTTVTYSATDVGSNVVSCSFNVAVELGNFSDTLTFIAGSANATCGGVAGINISTFNFDSLGSVQFTLTWNPTQLGFGSVSNLNPTLLLGAGNFGVSQTAQGILTFSWTTSSLAGTSLPDGAALFRINFNVLNNNGNVALVFGDVPTVREAYTNTTNPPEEVPAIWLNGQVGVLDNVPPTIVCPANVVVLATGGNTSAQVNNLQPLTLTDNCGGIVGLSFVRSGGTPGSGNGTAEGIYNFGMTTVVYTATDASGNSSTCSFKVTVEVDGSVSLLLDSVVVNCNQQQVAVNITVEDFSDLLGLQFSVFWDQTVLQFDTIDNDFPGLNLDASDFLGFLTTPNGILRFLGGDAVNGWPPIPDGGIFFTIYFNVLDPTATTNISFVGPYDAVDVNFNSIPLLTFNGFFQSSDLTPPTITSCPANIIVAAGMDGCTQLVNLAPPVATDDCSGVTGYTQTPPFNVFGAGVTAVVYTVSDSAGNTATCSFTVTVQDTFTPSFVNCPSNFIVEADDSGCSAVVCWQVPDVTDACGSNGLIITSNFNPCDIFPAGNTIVAYNVTDASGNSATCTFNVFVRDTIMPALLCPGDITVAASDTAASCSVIVDFAPNAAFDNCDNDLSIVSVPASGSLFPSGTTTVTFTATDDSGNTATCEFNITVEDLEAPGLTCPANITVPASANGCGAAVSWPIPVTSDNCDTLLVPTSNVPPGAFFPAGTTIVSYQVVDNSGNSANCSFLVTVNEITAPVFSNCPGDILIFLPTNDCDTTVTWTEPTATDNCALDTLFNNIDPGSVFSAGTTTVIYTAQDVSGNLSICAFDVFVVDQVAPLFSSCPQDTVISSGACGATYNWVFPTASDNCTPTDELVILTSGIPQDTFTFNVGTTSVLVLVQDASNNYDTCSFTVTVNSGQVPMFVNFPVNQNFIGCSAIATWDLPATSGFCDTVFFTSDYQPGDTFPAGVTIVTYTATDNVSQPITGTFTITVVENVPPVFTVCPQAAVVNTGASVVSDPSGFILFLDTVATCDAVQLEFQFPLATDDCSQPLVVQTAGPADGATLQVGDYTFAFLATDASGNTAVCSVNVTVLPLRTLNPFAQPNPGCAGDTITITAPFYVGATYTWTDPDGQSFIDDNSISFEIGPGTVGNYVLTAVINGCPTVADTIEIFQATEPVANDDLNYVVDPGGSLDSFNVLLNDVIIPLFDANVTQLSQVAGLTYHGNGLFSYDAGQNAGSVSFLYEVCSVACPDLCDMATVTISVRETDCSFIPNVITPNDDGVNDYLEIRCLLTGEYPDNALVVYNQWGDKVYEASPYSLATPWEGTLDGEAGRPLPDGTYFYIFTPAPNDAPLKGFVEIFR